MYSNTFWKTQNRSDLEPTWNQSMRNEENAEIRNIALILKKPHSYPCIMMIIPALEDIISCVHMQNAYI